MLRHDLALRKWCVLSVNQTVTGTAAVDACHNLTHLHTDSQRVCSDNLIKGMGEEGLCACVYVCLRDISGSVFWVVYGHALSIHITVIG